VSIFFDFVQSQFVARGRRRSGGSRSLDRRASNVSSEATEPTHSIDLAMMRRCIEISKETARNEFPFACLVCRDDQIVAESGNRVVQDCDVSQHAEIIALSLAQRVSGSRRLRGCTLYTNVEPCPMCSFAIRETGIARVVYAIKSPVMGGHSRWSILGDDGLSRIMPVYFAPPPKVVANFCVAEAEEVWSERHPIMWKLIKARGLLG
jgi:tRNA(adenine34) deaminase